MVQFDEPSLPAALAGRLTGVTGMSAVHAVDEPVAAALLDDCVAAVGGEVAIAQLCARAAVADAAAQHDECGFDRPVDADGR